MKRASSLFPLLPVFVAIFQSGCAVLAPAAPGPHVVPMPPPNSSFILKSSAFVQGSRIPQLYTCKGKDISPPLQWSTPPPGTKSLALIADDPDAPGGNWVHWVIYGVPAGNHTLPEGVPPNPILSDGSRNGRNSWQRLGYGGPCPPSGSHRYYFRLYALDSTLLPEAGATKNRVLAAIAGHVLAQAALMGVSSKDEPSGLFLFGR